MKDKTIKEIMNEDKKELNETSLGSFLSNNQDVIETVAEEQTESEKHIDDSSKDEANVIDEEENNTVKLSSTIETKQNDYSQSTVEFDIAKAKEDKATSNQNSKIDKKEIQSKPKKPKSKKRIKTVMLFLFVAVILSLSGLFVYQYMNNKPEIELNTTKITVECGSDIDYNAYIQSYNANKLEIKEINTNTLGKQIALYKAKNGFIVNEKELVIEVVDTKAPEFSLTTDTVEIERSEINDFKCYDYIDASTFKDNHDNFENLKCSCPALTDIEEKTNAVMIRYVLSDSSGNESYKELKVIIK